MIEKLRKRISLLLVFALLFSLFPVSLISGEQATAANAPELQTCSYITVDGVKDDYWSNVPTVGTSATKGWNEFHIDNLKLSNDCTYLYYWVDGVTLANWGENGLYLNLALSINGGADAGADANAPWGAGFNFSSAAEKPNFHVVSRIKHADELNGAAVYATTDLSQPIASSWGESYGAQFANRISTGFEGRIPLSLLNLNEGDTIKAIAVLSGNTANEHGAFDVIPESAGNVIADSWNEAAAPNTLSEYSAPYTITFEVPELVLTGTSPVNQAQNVSVSLNRIAFSFLGEVAWGDTDIIPTVSANEQPIPINASLEADAVVLELLEPLSYDTTYTAILPAGSIANLAENKVITFTTEKDPNTLNSYHIHYYRFDGQQNQWDIWTWDEWNDGREVVFTGNDADGFATATITSHASSINVITRPGNWDTQEETRVISMPEGQRSVEVWLLQGDPSVYYSADDVELSAKVQSAFMDSYTTIHVTTTEELTPEQLNAFNIIEQESNTSIDVTAQKLGSRSYRLTVDEGAIDVTKAYRVGHSAMSSAKLVFRNVLDDRQFYYSGNDLGLTYHESGSTFKLWAPTASEVAVVIYEDAGQYNNQGKVEDHSGGQETPLTRSSNGVWSGHIQGDLAGSYYMYHVQFADGASHYVVDPYARAVAANGQRTAIIDLQETHPVGWENDQKPPFLNPTDAIIYELHIRDFSIADDSGVSAANKGKFAAFTEDGLVDEFGHALAIDHLAELGITHLHLLPVYDFQTINELTVDDPASSNPKFNWGYDPQNYNVPEGSYSSDATNPAARITEFKQMVQALHSKGIRVVMDVVYNHTYSVEDGPFNKIVPGYYYRTNSNGTYSNGSGVGNEIATERPMVRKYIKDSVNYWAEQYHVDGFRFDLMGIIDTTTMKELTQELHQEVDPTILIYGEPWMGGSTPLPGTDQTLKGSQRDLNFAVFNDNFRSAIKGDSDGAGKGFATGSIDNSIDGILNGLIGATTDFTNAPTETINYVTAHDNLNLWDKIVRTQNLFDELNMLHIQDGELIGGGNVDQAVAAADPYRFVDPDHVLDNETVKRSLLANGIVLTAQGIPFIHAGDEMLRSKYGDHNSYRSPDSVNRINWSNKASFSQVNAYYKGLIELRKAHPAFRMTTKEDIDAHFTVLERSNGVIAFKLGEHANYDEWKNIVVIYNGTNEARSITLPASGDWHIVVDEASAGISSLGTVQGSVTVEPISMMVLYDEASSYQAEPSSIEVQLTKQAIEPGKELIATAIVKDQRGRVMAGEPVTWRSSDESVATISAAGRIKALASGTTLITAESGQLSATTQLHVAQLVPSELAITGDSFVYADFSTKLTANVKDQFGQWMSGQVLKWTSSDPSVALVDGTGMVAGISPGHAFITASIGDISSSISIEVKPYVKRYVQFEYSRPDQNYTDWDLWVWNTGVQNDAIPFTVVDGKAIARVEVAPNVTQIGFIVRRGNWLEKDTDADRFVNVRLDEDYVVVKLTSGQASFTQTASITGPVIEGNSVTFYYRDSELYRNNEHHRVTSVSVNINGESYPMVYDAAGEYYVYTLENLEEGEYPYTFVVTKDGVASEMNDPKNTVDGISKIVYKVIELEASVSVSPASFSYDAHSILTVQTDTPIELISRIYADLSELGGRSVVDIDKELMEVTISATDNVTAGLKTIPISIVDTNNVVHRISAEVTLQARHVENKHDFDWDEARIYFMLTDRFQDGDPSNNNPNGENYDVTHEQTYHGGDFQGIIDRLDYLEELGINTIWITPIVDNIDWNVGHGQPWQYQYGYHGYWAKDFTKLDEHLGDLDTFKELIDKAHDRGIKIMVDVVLNHVGYGMNAEDGRQNIPNYPTEQEQDVFAGLIRNPAGVGDVLGELAGLPDLRTEDAAVREQVIKWQVDWLERARTDRGDTIDYFRVDTVKHVDSTTWMQFKNELTKASPQFKLIGEVFGAYVDDQQGYLGSGMMDSLLDFNFKYIARDFINGNIDAVEQTLQARNEKLNSAETFGQFLSSHDEDGFLVAYAGSDESKQKIAAALQLTAKGQPVIYYGEELAMSGRNANFDAGNLGENRYDMPWDELEARSGMLTHYKKLLAARAAYSKVFAKGSRTKLAGGDSDQYIVFERAYQEDRVYVAINTSDEAKKISLEVDAPAGTTLTELYSGKKVTVNGAGKIDMELPARSDGGTLIIAHPAGEDKPTPNPPTTPTPVPNPTEPPATEGIKIGGEHLQGGYYEVTLTDVANQSITLEPGKLKHPVRVLGSNWQITISVEQLGAWAKQFTEVELKLSEAENNVKERIRSHAASQLMLTTLQSPLVELAGAGKQTAAAAPIGLEELTGITLHLAADSEKSLLTNVYRVLEDGSLHYVTAALVDGFYAANIDKAGMYSLIHVEKQFADVESSHWAASIIKQAAAKQLVQGKSIQTFDPNGSITRAEFTALIVRALGLTAAEAAPFADVAAGKWYAPSIAAAYKAGLVNGVNEHSFAPQSGLTREEMAVLLVRAIEYKHGATLAADSHSFADSEHIAGWALDAINKAVHAGLLHGKGNQLFDPKGMLTRAEAVKALLGLIK
ncbi:type I pullulanase [Paenibacillus septentrionalis]|uniref:pullulanase n=1 Tax=Paenibacillus septentrionalis TaxID=429342 RepID=A0ABW1V4N5_9BACL